MDFKKSFSLRTIKYVLATTIGLLSYFSAYSNENILAYNDYTGTQINETLTFQTIDPDYNGSENYVSTFTNPFVKISVDEDLGGPYVNYSYTIKLSITPYNLNGGVLPVVNKTLTVRYNPYTAGGNFNDAVYFELPNKYKIDVVVDDIIFNNLDANTTSSTTPNNIKLETGVRVNRYYELDETDQSTISGSNVSNSQIELSWTAIEGARSYDLEWTWVDSYGDTGVLGAEEIPLSAGTFKHNSTRINTDKISYKLPNIYSTGFIIFRVRAVGVHLNSISTIKYGNWSTYPTDPLANVNDWIFLPITNPEPDKNWQFQASYAEEGKKKEVVSYFDGTLRNRQTVTKINSLNGTDGLAIVGEVVYDNQGRPAIEILPVPANNNPSYLGYHNNFNLGASSNSPYNQLDFDWTDPVSGDDCEIDINGLKTSKGSGQYYSTNNASTSDFADLVPSAEDDIAANGSFPFSQIEYTPDNTGRIARKSGVGVHHKLGSGHEMTYLYVTPDQSELDRLFGYSVGYNLHYKKNVVIDPNGQVSISYIDPQGRTIATALAGENPDALLGLPDEENAALHVEVYSNILGTVSPDSPTDNNYPYASGNYGVLEDGYLYSGQKVVTTLNAGHQFDYELYLPEQAYVPSCFIDQTKGYPYVFQLELNINDDCNSSIFLPDGNPIETRVGAYTEFVPDPNPLLQNFFPLITKNQPYNRTEDMNDFQAPLEIGAYGITKDLVIDDEILDYFADDYVRRLRLTTNDCIVPFEAIEDGCFETCDECVESLVPGQTSTLANFQAYYTTGDGYIGMIPFIDLEPEAQGMLLTQLEDRWFQLLSICNAGCDPTTTTGNGGYNTNTASCTLGLYSMLQDLQPNGQYGVEYSETDENGDIVIATNSPETNVFEITNQLSYTIDLSDNYHSWRYPRHFVYDGEVAYNEGHYYDASGNIAKIELELIDPDTNPPTYEPSVDNDSSLEVEEVIDGSLTRYYLEPQYLANEADLFIRWEPYWAESLLVYHPEYRYYEYSEVLCSVTKTIIFNDTPATELTANSDGFDNYIKSKNYAEAKALGLFFNEDAIFNRDPYFFGNNVIDLESLDGSAYIYKQDIMNEAINNTNNGYDNTQKSMIELAYISRACNGIQTCTTPTSVSAIFSEVDGWSTEDKDEFWYSYLGHYQSLKEKIKYVMLNLYAHQDGSDGFYNGCIEIETTPTSIANVLNGYSAKTPIENIIGGNSFNGLCVNSGDIYNAKKKRYVPIDVLYDSDDTNGDIYNDLLDLTDLEYYLQTGNCPLMRDFELFLDGMVSQQAVVEDGELAEVVDITNSSWEYFGQYMTPRIFEEFVGPVSLPISGPINFNTSVNTSQELEIDVYSADNVVVLNAPANFNWDYYDVSNGWIIESMQNGYYTTYNGNGSFNFEIKARIKNLNGQGLVQEGFSDFIFTGSTIARIGECDLASGGGTAGGPGQTLPDDQDGDGIPDACDPCPNNPAADCSVVGCENGRFFSRGGTKDIIYRIVLPISSNIAMGSNLTVNFQSDDYPERITIEHGNLPLMDSGYVYPLAGESESDPWGVCYPGGLPPCSGGTYRERYFAKNGVDLRVHDYNGTEFVYGGVDEEASISESDLSLPENNGTTFYTRTFPKSASEVILKVYAPYDTAWNLNTNFCDNTINSFKSYIVSQSGNVKGADYEKVNYNPVTDQLVPVKDEPCYPCIPNPLPPVSCTDAYTQFVTIVNGISDYEPAFPYVDNVNDPGYWDAVNYFCNQNFEYAIAGYAYYIAAFNIQSVEDLQFISIAEFAAAGPQVTFNNYQIAIDAYVASGAVESWSQFIEGYTSSIPGYCPNAASIPDFQYPNLDNQTSCEEFYLSVVNAYGEDDFKNYLGLLKEEFKTDYIQSAMTSVQEKLNMTYNDKEYQYTLYYYDQAGNLVQTVSPEGVDRYEASELTGGVQSGINTVRDGNSSNTNLLPDHELRTVYKYNSLNQLVWQKTPDGGETRFAYDQLGRIIASQNEKQASGNSFKLFAENNSGNFSFSDDGKTITHIGSLWEGGYGIDILEGDGSVQWELLGGIADNNNVAVGLSYLNPNDKNATGLDNYNNIDYKMYTYKIDSINYRLAFIGDNRVSGPPNMLTPLGAVLRMERVNGKIYMYHNGIQITEFDETNPGEPMRLNFAMLRPGSKIQKLNYIENNSANSTSYTQRFSYTEYDELGRIVEAGEVATKENEYEINDIGKLIKVSSNHDVDKFEGFRPTYQITKTIYDKPFEYFQSGDPSINDSSDFFESYDESNSRNRVTAILYDEADNVYAQDIIAFNNAIFYNYDIHGNVKEVVNYYKSLYNSNTSDQYIKKVSYEYDLISGNVKKVTYQKNKNDQFIHTYEYDADNRITKVNTSKDGVIWENDASYQYYEHGPLARIQVGDKNVQGQDFVYTLQGWLKSVNGEYITNPQNDFGEDGTIGSLVAKDVFGYSLGYFENDYKPTGTISNAFSVSNPTENNLYNGNIRQMVTSMRKSEDVMLNTQANLYQYDQLNRIKGMNSTSYLANAITLGTGYQSYNTNYSYDRNGNLQTLVREVFDEDNPEGGIEVMDQFEDGTNPGYKYLPGTNKLALVKDDVASTSFSIDIDDQTMTNVPYDPNNTDSHNYVYDNLGQLVMDRSEKITIRWRVDGKVASVSTYTDDTFDTKIKTIYFDYDGLGNRVTKRVLEHTSKDITEQFYVRDAQGNVLSVLETEKDGASDTYQDYKFIRTKEFQIYGSSRLGVEVQDYPSLTTEEPDGDAVEPDNSSPLVLELKNTEYATWEVGNFTEEPNHSSVNYNLGAKILLKNTLPLNDTLQVGSLAFANIKVQKSGPSSTRENRLNLYLTNQNGDYIPYFTSVSIIENETIETIEIKPTTGVLETDAITSGIELSFNSNITSSTLDGTLVINNTSYTPGTGLNINSSIDTIAISASSTPISQLGGYDNDIFQIRDLTYFVSTEHNSITDSFTLTEGVSAPMNSDATIAMVMTSANDEYWQASSFDDTATAAQRTIYKKVGDRRYELANHLGNVLSVVSDKKIPTFTGSSLSYFNADIKAYNDYYPFGMLLPNRHANTPDYRYGFQGQEMDDEIKGEGNNLNFTFRMHDPRVGRFFAVDPLTSKYSHYSPFSFSGNKVISSSEIEGLEESGLWNAYYWSQQAGKAVTGDETEGAVYAASLYSKSSVLAFGIGGSAYALAGGGVFFAEMAIANPLLFAELSNEATAFIWGLATDEIYVNPTTISDEIGQGVRRTAGALSDDLYRNGSKILREISVKINPSNSPNNCVDCAIQFQRFVTQGVNDIMAKADDGVDVDKVFIVIKEVFGESNTHRQPGFKNNVTQLFEGLNDVGQESAIILGKLRQANGEITHHAFNGLRDNNGVWHAVDAQTGNIYTKEFLNQKFSYYQVFETIVETAQENVKKN